LRLALAIGIAAAKCDFSTVQMASDVAGEASQARFRQRFDERLR
jgi:hypothetical protein